LELVIHQQITIHRLDVGSVSNSSVLQIGTAGVIKGLSNLYNTGGFTGPAPELQPPAAPFLVPLPAPGS
jgi:spore germination protein PB